MARNRISGVLCHPTSLSGGQGVGGLGKEARAFVDWLSEAGQTLWQVLPLGPTGYGDSPYACSSAFAGNPLLIDIESLAEHGYADLGTPPANGDSVDFEATKAYKLAALRQAYQRFEAKAPPMERQAFASFRRAPEHRFWLEDFALFSALKEAHDHKVWSEWSEELMNRNPAALARWAGENEDAIEFHVFCQWIFTLQWDSLRTYAASKNVEICGDMPIFVAYDSADVWSHPSLFHLDSQGHSTHVAGVPPDYFSKTGQLWGNPLYRWDVMARDGFHWWVERFRANLRQVDMVRVDHFRGFAAFWAIPAGEETAINGQWIPGPGAHFFASVEQQLGRLPLIAEDLGTISDDVHHLRDRFGLPGMKILQFAFSDPKNAYLPHNYDTPNCVVYTGTHDNNTTLGWWESIEEAEQGRVKAYLGLEEGDALKDVTWRLIQLALNSTADTALFPIQDILGLGAEGRMNTPGEAQGNWSWRVAEGALTPALAQALLEPTYGSARTGLKPAKLIAAEAAKADDTEVQS